MSLLQSHLTTSPACRTASVAAQNIRIDAGGCVEVAHNSHVLVLWLSYFYFALLRLRLGWAAAERLSAVVRLDVCGVVSLLRCG